MSRAERIEEYCPRALQVRCCFFVTPHSGKRRAQKMKRARRSRVLLSHVLAVHLKGSAQRLDGFFEPVGSRYSCGFPMVETEQPAKPFTALNGAL